MNEPFALLEAMDRRERERRGAYCVTNDWGEVSLLGAVLLAIGPEPKRRHPCPQVGPRDHFTTDAPLTKRQRRRHRGNRP